MIIRWYGHACFRLRSREVAIVTDPFDKSVGYPLPRVQADVVTISHDHRDHNNASIVRGSPKVIDRPGEYEVRGVFITGISTYHDAQQGRERGKNIVFSFEMEELTLCHLGDLGHIPNDEVVDRLGQVDVLFVPVGGVYTIDAAQAAEVVNLLGPRIVIPMHYQTERLQFKLDPVDRFLSELGIEKAEPLDRLNVNARTLPEEAQVVLLSYGS